MPMQSELFPEDPAPTTRYRVWPDGTVQEAWQSPHPWMSDDYEYVEALDEQCAWQAAYNNEGSQMP